MPPLKGGTAPALHRDTSKKIFCFLYLIKGADRKSLKVFQSHVRCIICWLKLPDLPIVSPEFPTSITIKSKWLATNNLKRIKNQLPINYQIILLNPVT
jgi:hypothetical protein